MPEDLGAFVAHGFAGESGGGFHGETGDKLEHVVLDDIADGAGFFVKFAAALYSERFGHGDFHVVDVVAVPGRFPHGIGEAGVHDILDGLFAEVVVDAEDRGFGEELVQGGVECLCGSEIASEGFFDNDARARVAAGIGEAFGDGGEHAGRDGEVVNGAFGFAEFFAKLDVGLRVFVIAIDVAEEGREFFEGLRVCTAAVFIKAGFDAGFELIEIPAGFGDTDDGDVEVIVQDHGLE